MTVKRFTLFALVSAILAALALVVSAQDSQGRGFKQGRFGFGPDGSSILEATGLESEAALWEALQDGSTIAELIEANGGDVDSVIAELVAAATDDINARVAAMLEADITAQFRGGLGRFEGGKGRPMPRGGFGLRGMEAIILEATGLESEAALREALKDGSTIAELIEANDGDVDSVIAELTAAVTEDINAAAAAKLETLEADITTRIHSRFERVGFRGFGFWRMDKAKEA